MQSLCRGLGCPTCPRPKEGEGNTRLFLVKVSARPGLARPRRVALLRSVGEQLAEHLCAKVGRSTYVCPCPPKVEAKAVDIAVEPLASVGGVARLAEALQGSVEELHEKIDRLFESALRGRAAASAEAVLRRYRSAVARGCTRHLTVEQRKSLEQSAERLSVVLNNKDAVRVFRNKWFLVDVIETPGAPSRYTLIVAKGSHELSCCAVFNKMLGPGEDPELPAISVDFDLYAVKSNAAVLTKRIIKRIEREHDDVAAIIASLAKRRAARRSTPRERISDNFGWVRADLYLKTRKLLVKCLTLFITPGLPGGLVFRKVVNWLERYYYHYYGVREVVLPADEWAYGVGSYRSQLAGMGYEINGKRAVKRLF